ncbi:hypothetical protein P7K49_005023, partial [Saguinus oedipus]
MVSLKIWDVSSSAVKTVAFVISSVVLIGILSGNDGTNVNMTVSKLTSWAAIASKPAKPWPKMERKNKPVMGGSLLTPSIKHNMDIDTWDNMGPVLQTLAPQPIPSSQAVSQPLKVPQLLPMKLPALAQPEYQSPQQPLQTCWIIPYMEIWHLGRAEGLI